MFRRQLRHSILVVAALLPSFAACDGVTACTSMGCFSGLLVKLDALPTGAFTVELYALSPDVPPVYLYECDPGGGGTCQQEIFFGGLVTHRVFARITTTAGSVVRELMNYEYEERRINGPRCGVTCRVAEVTAAIP